MPQLNVPCFIGSTKRPGQTRGLGAKAKTGCFVRAGYVSEVSDGIEKIWGRFRGDVEVKLKLKLAGSRWILWGGKRWSSRV